MSLLENIAALCRGPWHAFKRIFDSGPIETVDELVEFVQTRAAFVAQTSLFNYIKARMSPEHAATLDDHDYATSLTIAKWQTYSACLADMSIYAAATCGRKSDLSQQEMGNLARDCYQTTVRKSFVASDVLPLANEVIEEFEQRLGDTDWQNVADGKNAFTAGQAALLQWAPITERFKQEDTEKVADAIHFRWQESRREFNSRTDFSALKADLLSIRT